MADAFGQAVADPLRPLRIFAPVMAVLAPLFLLAALGLGLSALSAEPDTIATGKGGSLVLPDGTPRELTVYGATADGSAPLGSGSVDCTLTSQSTARIFTGYQRGSATVDGEALDAVAKVDGPWAGGTPSPAPDWTGSLRSPGRGLARDWSWPGWPCSSGWAPSPSPSWASGPGPRTGRARRAEPLSRRPQGAALHVWRDSAARRSRPHYPAVSRPLIQAWMAAQELQPLYARSHDLTLRRQLNAAVVLDATWRATCRSLTTDPDLDSLPAARG